MSVLNKLEKTLETLKDFQRETVRSILASYDSGSSQRILVADEVGLGKTVVAKGVIAELLKKKIILQKTSTDSAPLRVTYICSNLTLADENRKKLAIFHGDDQKKFVLQPTFGRLLETAIKIPVEKNSEKLLEICSLTPSTSFNLTQGHGNKFERKILCAALIRHPQLKQNQMKLSQFFRDGVNGWDDGFQDFLDNVELHENIVNEFHSSLDLKLTLTEIENCEIELSSSTWLSLLHSFCNDAVEFNHGQRVRSSLRSLLAKACAKHLVADLFILDEFQRFKELLNSDQNSDQSLIAKQIFSNKKGKILLLSATPFKAVSSSEDDEEGNAHADELNYLLKFISDSNAQMLMTYEGHRKKLQQQILKLKDSQTQIRDLDDAHKTAIEKLLSPYLCRTERVQISEFYENLFQPAVQSEMDRIKNFSKNEIDVFKILDELSVKIQDVHKGRSASQMIEFYKASPWPLSFLNGYQFKKNLELYRNDSGVKRALRNSEPAWLHQSSIQNYQLSLDAAPQAKMRYLVQNLFNTPSEELLWVPPSLPHYPLEGCFKGQENFSKTLLFSSWAMVPRALSGLLTYEAERRLLKNRKGVKKQYFKDVKHSNTIRFDAKSSGIGWSLVYPSKVLSELKPTFDGCLSDQLIARADLIDKLLTQLKPMELGQKIDDKWFYLAPMLLDQFNHKETEKNVAEKDKYLQKWINGQKNHLNMNSHKGIDAQFQQIVDFFSADVNNLGLMPDGLAKYLAQLSISGPGISVLRSFQKNAPIDSEVDLSLVATEVAFGMVAMFNKPESENILRKRYPQIKYFQAISSYCCDGDLQAVIDEYVHMLKDAGVPFKGENKSDSYTIPSRLMDVLGFRTSSVSCQFSEQKNKSEALILKSEAKPNNRNSLRCHYAVPLGNQRMTDEKALERVSNVRDAFNSPFRPFVLNSTNIGQEGLDFHWYCSQVVHWNLPANAIDIEQREGRVNRFKSLVVRRRLAEGYNKHVVSSDSDPWSFLFDVADRQTKAERRSDLVPYWHLPEGKAKIVRFVPMMPLSRDVLKFDRALQVLALYRLAFGQPRQEELLDNLLKRKFTTDEISKITEKLVINLSPMSRRNALKLIF